MKVFFTVLFLSLAGGIFGQEIVGFEAFEVPADSFLNGSDGAGGFANNYIFLPNEYNPEFGSWSGWSLSSKRDTLTPGFTNPYSAIAGSGVDVSANYAVSFSSGENRLHLEGAAKGSQLSGIYLTNSTYAYLSMRDGDAFAKRFGGVSGDDPDFFLLTIKAYSDGRLSTDSVNFYLADFRFADNKLDYIVKDWTFVNLSVLGPVDSLSFNLSSSDVGQFGMNTPAFFCMDNLELGTIVNTEEALLGLQDFQVFPNPTLDYIQIDYDHNRSLSCLIMDLQGRILQRKVLSKGSERLALGDLPAGTYVVSLIGEGFRSSKLLHKQ